MADISTTYMGLKLKSPIITGSSGLTKSVEKIIELEKAGAGAVVLKSLFEEQIKYEINQAFATQESLYAYPEAEDYIANYSKEKSVSDYLELIRGCKKAVQIPVIASINCFSPYEWTSFAKKIQDAGADALELNIFILPSDPDHSSEKNEETYFSIITEVQKHVTIPIAVKISSYFSSLAKMAIKLSWTHIGALVIFNRFFSPDIDIERMRIISSNVYSTPEELSNTLRWVAILSDRVHCDIAASTGIHSGEAVVKQLLAGAKAVQVSSVLYQKGFGHIGTMVKDMENWMQKHEFGCIEDFRGKLSYSLAENPAAYERVQFMKHFAGIE